MTKIDFEYESINAKLLPKLESTISYLNDIKKESVSAIMPSGCPLASTYQDALRRINKLSSGLNNTKEDLIRANNNYKAANDNSLKNISEFSSDYKIEEVDPVVQAN